MKEEDIEQIVTGLLVRVSSLESLLIESGHISRGKYTDELAARVNEIKGALEKAKEEVKEDKEDKEDKVLS